MRKLYFISVFLLCYVSVFSQEGKPVIINIHVLTDSDFKINNASNLKIETLKFYISNVQLRYNNTNVFTEEYSFHLIDISDTTSQKFNLTIPQKTQFNSIIFNLGIDSNTNVSGALSGDLDPTKGMYWTWQSGYINIKLEGTSSNRIVNNGKFEFHLGGYLNPYNPIQKISLETYSQNNIDVLFNLNPFFENVDITTQQNIMSPSAEAVRLSEILTNCFSIK